MRGHGKAAWLLGVFGGQDVGLESVLLTRGYSAACIAALRLAERLGPVLSDP